MRNVDEKIWSDDWFAEQEPIGKLVWLGLITRVADDQGRFRHNADLVKSQLFPMSSEPSATTIDLWMATFIKDGRLMSYEAGGKKLLQIRNWWKYQAGSNWMKASDYLPPAGWMDWYKYQSKTGVVSSKNEKSQAGLQDTLQATHEATQQEPLQGGYDNINVNDNDNIKKEEKENPFKFFSDNIAPMTVYSSQELKALCEEYSDEWVIDAMKEAVNSNARNPKFIKTVLANWKAHHKGWKPETRKGYSARQPAQDVDLSQKWTAAE